jgi:hypothetical protein
MKTLSASVVVAVSMLSLAALVLPKDAKTKSALLTGTWECVSHGTPHGDINFTLYLEQNKETVTGSVSSPIGSADFTAGTFKKNALEIHIDTSQGNYLLNGKYRKGELAGDWSTDSGLKGAWEGKKSLQTGSSK